VERSDQAEEWQTRMMSLRNFCDFTHSMIGRAA